MFPPSLAIAAREGKPPPIRRRMRWVGWVILGDMTSELVELQRPRNALQRFLAVGGRVGITTIALLLQIVVFVVIMLQGRASAPWVGTASIIVSLGVLALILNSRMQIEYKLAWTIPILLMPLLGGVFYLMFGSRTGTRRQMTRYKAMQDVATLDQVSAPGLVRVRAGEPGEELLELETADLARQPAPLTLPIDPDAARQINYLANSGPFVAYHATQTTYYPVGEEAFDAMLEALEGAQHWIAMEYFIVSEGQMWDRVFEVLARKAATGVKVWFLYDDLGSIFTLPSRFIKTLTKAGIRVQPVNRFGPGLTLRYNNRDHRKLTIVDGVIAFTGGLNIADEYINVIDRFGHWKDTSIRLTGPGAWGMATLFFTMWDLITGEHTDLVDLHPSEERVAELAGGEGIVVSYDDTPFDDFSLGWSAYRNLMTRAHHRVDLMTPYFVPTNEMVSVFTSLAASGIQVRLITPGIPDKAYVYSVTRSNYRPLVEAGVEVYEYTPGFLHAKQMVVDDEFAIIGTINFDFRSFYLHQENAVWMYRTSALPAMTADFEATVEKCRRITLAEVRSARWWRRALWIALRTFSPLM